MAEEIVLTGPKTSLQEDLTRLYSQGFLTDITLSTEDGKNFEAHRILLAARSHYFHSIVPRLKSEPVIFLKGVKGAHLDKILKYIYSGSVSLSRHQLKPILEVAKSLQVKGLYDANPADILSRQGLTGPSPSAVQAIASRTGGNPAMIAASMQARAQQRQMVSPTSSVDKTTTTSFRPSSSGASSAAASRANSKNRFLGYKTNTVQDDDSESDDEIIVNKSKQDSDLDDDDDNDDEDDDDEEISKVVAPRAETPPKPKRKRGRPPKNKKPEPSYSKNESKETDPYDFDADDNASASTTNHMRSVLNEEKGKQKKVKEDEDEEGSTTKRERSNKYGASAINGKQILTVKCKNQTAELHLSRFANGIRGNSIKYKDQWMTPQEFEDACGTSNNKYLENLQTDYGPLKTLTASGMLKPHSRKCRCSVCRGEETSPKTDKLKAKKRPKNDEEEGGEEEEDEDDNKDRHEEQQNAHEEDHPEQHHSHHKDKERGSAKRKKKKHMRDRDEWRKQLLAEQLKQEQQQQAQQQQHQQQQAQHQQALGQQHNTITIMEDGSTFDQQQLHQVHLQQPQEITYVTAISTMNPTMVSTLSDMPPKISTPTVMQNRIEPPPLNAPATFYVMSPHPHMTAPPTPQHNPFANMGPPPPSPAPSLASTMSSPPIMTAQKSNGLKDSASSGGSNTSTPTSSSNAPVSTPRMGPIMNVRCKSTTAVMYTAKYESGSKGKCIQLGEEWLTPNEFEDRAGSKAKKYLSSIKCLGRPLRVFVNSGELKGSGPPPAQKVQKKVKPSTMQPIAPAPPHSHTPVTGGILTQAPTPLGQIATAPPTPSHISSAPPIPANLNMVMGGHSQPPILINQTSMAPTIMGNQAMMPMTFTIGAPIGDPIDVRAQNVSQAM